MVTYEITDFTGVFKINISGEHASVLFNAFFLPEMSLPRLVNTREILRICTYSN